MRILIVTDNFPPRAFGGMAQHALHIARFLGERHDVLVLTLRKDKGRVARKDEPFAVCPLLTKRFPRFDFWTVRRLARSFRADVAHVCTAGLADERLSAVCPVVTRTVGNDFLRPWCGYNLPVRSLLYRLPGAKTKTGITRWETETRKVRIDGYLRASHTVVANSGWTRERLLERGVPSDRVKTIVGGLDTKTFYPSEDKVTTRKALGLPAEAPVITTAGNLIRKKGVDTVLRALALLNVKPKPHYLIVGDGPEEANLLRLVAELELQDQVRFVGRKRQAELATHYQASDVYVLASQEETMGRTYFEAGACGIAVIGARVGGVPDVVEHGMNGLLVDDPEDVDAVANAIQSLLADPARRDRMGAAGLERARTEFSWDVVGSAYEKVLSSAISYACPR